MEHPNVYLLTVKENKGPQTAAEVSEYVDAICRGRQLLSFIRNRFTSSHAPIHDEYIVLCFPRIAQILAEEIRKSKDIPAKKAAAFKSFQHLTIPLSSPKKDPTRLTIRVPRGITDRIARKLLTAAIGKFAGHDILRENQYTMNVKSGIVQLYCYVKQENQEAEANKPKRKKPNTGTSILGIATAKLLLNYFQWFVYNPTRQANDYFYSSCNFAYRPKDTSLNTPLPDTKETDLP